jgi:thiamine-monophosphate kinase
VLTLAITVVGHAQQADDFVLRSGAEPGDVLVLTGELGGAGAGRLLLDRPELGADLTEATAAGLRDRQLAPTPRLRSGQSLAAAGATAMIDLSDGLAGDARHLAHASCVGLRIEAGSLPLARGVAELAAAAGKDPLQMAVSAGEDYELLAALPPDRLDEAFGRMADEGETTLTTIGEVVAGEGVELRLPEGGLLESQGYDHFEERSSGAP